MLRLFSPFYQTVFKRLFNHSSVATKIVSCLLGQTIHSSKRIFSPPTVQREVRPKDVITLCPVCSVDYQFHIETKDGSNSALEMKIMQGKKPIDYAIYGQKHTVTQEERSAPMFVCFLEEQVKGCDVTVLEKRNGAFVDKETGHEIGQFDSSFKWLTEGSIVVQISALENCRHDTLKKVLSIFVHAKGDSAPVRTVLLDEDGFPSDYFEIVERLAFITVDVDVLANLFVEDDYLSVLIWQERELAKKDELIAQKKAINILVEKRGISRKEAEKLVRGK